MTFNINNLKLYFQRAIKISIYFICLCIILFLCLEIFLRLFGFHGENDTKDFIQYDALLGWSFIPNRNATFMGLEWKVPYSINEDGLRERTIMKNKTGDLYYILILGDSSTEGYGIRKNRRFSDLIENMFNKKGKKVEIINAGIRGYNLSQYYLSFQRLYEKYEPDLVIIVTGRADLDVTNNSIFPEASRLYYRPYYNLENGQLVLKGVPVHYPNISFQNDKLEIFKQYLRQYSVSYTFLRIASDRNIFLKKIILLLRLKKDISKSQQYRQAMRDTLYNSMLLNRQTNERVSTAIIKKMDDTIKKNQGNMLIFLISDDILDNNAIYYRKLCIDLGIFYASFSELSQIYKNNKSRYHFKFDGHFNEEGNLLIAKSLYRFLNTNILKK